MSLASMWKETVAYTVETQERYPLGARLEKTLDASRALFLDHAISIDTLDGAFGVTQGVHVFFEDGSCCELSSEELSTILGW